MNYYPNTWRAGPSEAHGPHRRGAQCKCIGCIGLRPTLGVSFLQPSATKSEGYTGPSPGCSSKEGQKPEAGAKNRKVGHILNIQYRMYAATGGPNVKWGGTDFKLGGRAPLALPLATALRLHRE